MDQDKTGKDALQAGPAVAIVPDGPDPETATNMKMRGLIERAYAAGFITEVKSVSYGKYGHIILYELETDPGFHDPIG